MIHTYYTYVRPSHSGYSRHLVLSGLATENNWTPVPPLAAYFVIPFMYSTYVGNINFLSQWNAAFAQLINSGSLIPKLTFWTFRWRVNLLYFVSAGPFFCMHSEFLLLCFCSVRIQWSVLQWTGRDRKSAQALSSFIRRFFTCLSLTQLKSSA